MTNPTRFGDTDFLATWGAAWSGGDPDVLLAYYSTNATYQDVGSNLTFNGHSQISKFFTYMLKFSPDSFIEFDRVFGDTNGFAADWTWSGTAAGPLRLGDQLIPAAHVKFSVPGVAFCTLGNDGLIASHEDYYDMRSIVEQLSQSHLI
jgi:steroid delta-isomerase-like uncharacterized protein